VVAAGKPAAAEKKAVSTGSVAANTSPKKAATSAVPAGRRVRSGRSTKRGGKSATTKKKSKRKSSKKAPSAAPKRAASREKKDTSRSARKTKSKPRRKSTGDDVDDILGALDNGGSKKKQKNKNKSKRAVERKAPKPPADSLLPKKLGRVQILSVVRRNIRGVAACKDEGSGDGGTVMVAMVIARTGKVSSAKVKTGQFRGTPVGRCVERKVGRFQFPQFSGKSMKINMPFRL
jgi:hypothetical protein